MYETTTFAGKSVLVTGASGRRSSTRRSGEVHQRVYAGTRQPLTCADARVTPGMFDVTDRTHT